LFPTRFYTEGIPGTIIDAYAAGIPVISSKWESFADVMKEGVTGWGFDFGDFEQFRALLEKAAKEPKVFSLMKITALEEMKRFQPQEVIQKLTQGMI
jgi:glycosyltransferase involved in cell wall biosynthesis